MDLAQYKNSSSSLPPPVDKSESALSTPCVAAWSWLQSMLREKESMIFCLPFFNRRQSSAAKQVQSGLHSSNIQEAALPKQCSSNTKPLARVLSLWNTYTEAALKHTKSSHILSEAVCVLIYFGGTEHALLLPKHPLPPRRDKHLIVTYWLLSSIFSQLK